MVENIRTMGRFVLDSVLIIAISCGGVLSIEPNVYWRDYHGGAVPKDALDAATNDFIGQVQLSNCGLVPGTFYPGKKVVITEGENKKLEFSTNIKLLCTPNPQQLEWQHVNVNSLDQKIIQKAILGGYEIGTKVYIGKVFHEGEWKIGKVFPPGAPYKGLRVWWNNGGGYFPADFQILVNANP